MHRQSMIMNFVPGTIWFMGSELWYQQYPSSMERDLGPPYIINDSMAKVPDGSLVMIVKMHERGLWCVGLLREKMIKIFLPETTEFNPVQFRTKGE